MKKEFIRTMTEIKSEKFLGMIRNLPPWMGEFIWDIKIKTALSGLHFKAKVSAFVNAYWVCP